jgi:hypothetical protein
LDITHPEYSLNLLTSQAVLANPNYIYSGHGPDNGGGGGATQNNQAALRLHHPAQTFYVIFVEDSLLS